MLQTQKVIEKKPGCVECALKVVGKKWTGLIIRELSDSTRRFNELSTALPTITPRILSQRLDELELQKIVSKKYYRQIPPKVEYSLTAKGYDLVPVLQQMAAWGHKYQK